MLVLLYLANDKEAAVATDIQPSIWKKIQAMHALRSCSYAW